VAAKRLGISVSVLKALRGSGIYEVKHLLPTRAGFHELDLNLFTEKMLDLVPNQEPSRIRGRETVTLQSVLCGRRDSLEIKLNLVRALLSRNIPALSNSDGTVGGLVIVECPAFCVPVLVRETVQEGADYGEGKEAYSRADREPAAAG
jgi:hypothetical protein